MASVLRVSDAASIGLHAMVLLAASPERLLSNREIATQLKVSEAHLSKVLQRLSRAGFVRATRGPRGGFAVRPGAERSTLLSIYEQIEGPLKADNCLLSTRICGGRKCIFADLLKRVNGEVRRYFSKTRLTDLTGVYRSRR